MIITRTPLRISFVGGGSDMPWFYKEEPGTVVSAAIDKYVYVTYSKKYEGTFRAAYSQIETTSDVEGLRHELIRECLRANRNHSRLGGREIHSIADIPGGTGLGSSSAFTVGMLKAMYPRASTEWLALHAINVELERCAKHIGIQDQYTAAFGGVHQYTFGPLDTATPQPIICDYLTLSTHVLLLDTGLRRFADASTEIAAQPHDRELTRELATIAGYFAKALATNELKLCGAMLEAAWDIKRKFVSNDAVDQWYREAKWGGAWGGKLCGAGGGGFLMFLAPPEVHGRIIQATKLRHVPVRVGVEGSKVIYSD